MVRRKKRRPPAEPVAARVVPAADNPAVLIAWCGWCRVKMFPCPHGRCIVWGWLEVGDIREPTAERRRLWRETREEVTRGPRSAAPADLARHQAALDRLRRADFRRHSPARAEVGERGIVDLGPEPFKVMCVQCDAINLVAEPH